MWALQRLTLCFHKLSLLGAGLAVVFTADVVEGEEQVVFLMQLSRQLNLELINNK